MATVFKMFAIQSVGRQLVLLCSWLAAFGISTVAAHPALPSQLVFFSPLAESGALDAGEEKAIQSFSLTMPVDQLHLAELSLPATLPELTADARVRYRDYLRQHVKIYRSAERQQVIGWSISGWQLDSTLRETFGTELIAVKIQAAEPLPATALLDVDTLVHRVVNHRTLVTLAYATSTDGGHEGQISRHDFQHRYQAALAHDGAANGQNDSVNAAEMESGWEFWLRRKYTEIPMAQVYQAQQDWLADRATNRRSNLGYLGYGFEHIALGPDHLMFMLCLLLPAPLWGMGLRLGTATAQSAGRTLSWRRWGTPVLKPLAIQVSCFTFGHMTSLLLAAAGWMLMPVVWVEIGVALTILLAALSVLKPGSKPGAMTFALTLLFGLIHGSAFAEILHQLNRQEWDLLWSLLAFNLGVELMQLLLVVALLPPLLWLASRHARVFLRLQTVLAVALAAIASGWIVQRLEWLPMTVSDTLDRLSDGLPVALACGWLLLLLVIWALSLRQPPQLVINTDSLDVKQP